MASVDSRTKISIDELVNGTVISGSINSGGHLILETRGGALIDAGSVVDPGGSGSSTVTQKFHFATPANTWTCVHNLGQSEVDVTVFDNSGTVVWADVYSVDVDTIEIDFYYPTSGYALIQF